ncbi:MAG TPA: ABC transporter ATP-binding protein [bacterium]|jgi:ABC-2 type transport system ATP-binding protein
MSDIHLLRVHELSKALGGKPVLHQISLELQRGEFLGLIGPNGAGKTTLLHCITGQWTAPAGSVTIDGIDVATDPLAAKRVLSCAFEPGDFIERLTGRQHLDFMAGIRNLKSPAEEIYMLAELVDLGESLDTELGAYSFGMKQKLAIMLALLGHPPFVVLDESLNGLDPVVGYRVKNHLKDLAAEGRTGILLASHMLESLERYCTRISMIREGRIYRHWTQEELEAEAAASGKHLEDLFVELMGVEE